MCFIFIYPSSAFAESECTARKNTAIIIVPGILSTGLFYTGNDSRRYKHNEALWLAVGRNNSKNVKSVAKFLLFNKDLGCDDDGIPVNDNVGIPADSRFCCSQYADVARYGVLSTYRNLINTLENNFGENSEYGCSIILYNYDWRIDPCESAKLLADKIMEFDEVVLIGYSLGGLVSSACARELWDKGELDRIKTFISVAVPYNGSVEALYTFENGLRLEMKVLDGILKLFGITKIVKRISNNCASMYALLPNEHFFERRSSGYLLDSNNNELSYEDTVSFIRSRPWYKKKNGENKKFLEDVSKFHERVYVNGKHIINYFRSSNFIVGTGRNTAIQLKLPKKAKSKVGFSKFVDGDGTVPLAESALPPLDAGVSSNIFKVSALHSKMFDENQTLELVVRFITERFSVRKIA